MMTKMMTVNALNLFFKLINGFVVRIVWIFSMISTPMFSMSSLLILAKNYHAISLIPHPPHCLSTTRPFIYFSTSSFKVIKSYWLFANKKSFGHDGTSVYVLKLVSVMVNPILANSFNRCFEES